MACDCISEFNKRLVEHNTKIEPSLIFPMDGTPCSVVVCIHVEKIERRGKRPVVVAPTFCPFCGVAYREAPQPTPQRDPAGR